MSDFPIMELAKGLFYLEGPLYAEHNKWDYVDQRVRDLYIAKARFVWSFVDDKRSAFTMDKSAVPVAEKSATIRKRPSGVGSKDSTI